MRLTWYIFKLNVIPINAQKKSFSSNTNDGADRVFFLW